MGCTVACCGSRRDRLEAGRRSPLLPSRWRPVAHVGRRCGGSARLATDQREEAPAFGGLVGETGYGWRYAAPLLANLPRSVFLNRDSAPFLAISRMTAE